MRSNGLKVLLVGPYPLEPARVSGGVEAVMSILAPAIAAHSDVSHVTVLSFHNGLGGSGTRRIDEKL